MENNEIYEPDKVEAYCIDNDIDFVINYDNVSVYMNGMRFNCQNVQDVKDAQEF